MFSFSSRRRPVPRRSFFPPRGACVSVRCVELSRVSRRHALVVRGGGQRPQARGANVPTESNTRAPRSRSLSDHDSTLFTGSCERICPWNYTHFGHIHAQKSNKTGRFIKIHQITCGRESRTVNHEGEKRPRSDGCPPER